MSAFSPMSAARRRYPGMSPGMALLCFEHDRSRGGALRDIDRERPFFAGVRNGTSQDIFRGLKLYIMRRDELDSLVPIHDMMEGVVLDGDATITAALRAGFSLSVCVTGFGSTYQRTNQEHRDEVAFALRKARRALAAQVAYKRSL